MLYSCMILNLRRSPHLRKPCGAASCCNRHKSKKDERYKNRSRIFGAFMVLHKKSLNERACTALVLAKVYITLQEILLFLDDIFNLS